MRLQKYLAGCGIASRRKCESYILEGKVTVNGIVIQTLGTQVEEGDRVCFEGKQVHLECQEVYYLLNKPIGYVTTRQDEKGRATVLDLLKEVKERVFPVGRLDYLTSGLLILTNDGALTYALTHPKHHVNKTYLVKVKGSLSDEAIERLQKGVWIEGQKTYPAQVKKVKKSDHMTQFELTIHEGRNRQVRKMCEAVGYPVESLCRIALGPLTLDGLKIGTYRALTPKEVKQLKETAGLK